MATRAEADQAQVVELVRWTTISRPAFPLDVPNLLLLCALEYASRGKPSAADADVTRLPAAKRAEYEARAKRAIAAAVRARLIGITNLGRVALFADLPRPNERVH